MRRFILPPILLVSLVFTSCGLATPEKYFDAAVLNTHFLHGFANNGQIRDLESPSGTMGIYGELIPLTRKQIIEIKIDFVSSALEKLENLRETKDTKEIIRNSIALYKLALTVYQTEYLELAELFDQEASKEEIEEKAQVIHDTYYETYDDLYTNLIKSGKLYAEKHNIKVEWSM